GGEDALEVALRVLGHGIGEVLEQDPREAVDDTQRSPQVVRDRVAEGLELAASDLQLERSRRLLAARFLAACGQRAEAGALGGDGVDQDDAQRAPARPGLRLDDQHCWSRFPETVEDRSGQSVALLGIERFREARSG